MEAFCTHFRAQRRSELWIGSASSDNSVLLWNFDIDMIGTDTYVEEINYLKYCEELVISGHSNGDIHVWEAKSFRLVKTFVCKYGVNSVDLSYNKEMIVSCDQWITVWDVKYTQELFKFYVQSQSVIFDPFAKWVLSGDSKGAIHIIDIEMGNVINSFSIHSAPILSLGFYDNSRLSRFVRTGGSEYGTCSMESISIRAKRLSLHE